MDFRPAVDDVGSFAAFAICCVAPGFLDAGFNGGVNDAGLFNVCAGEKHELGFVEYLFRF